VKVHSGGGIFVDTEWQHIRVGDVVQVQRDQFFPADILMLSSSYPDGVCYVETMNLDGETNLKLKKTLESTLELEGDENFAEFVGIIRCEDPNPNLYSFIGNIEYDGATLALGPQQILLRDSKLRNTQYVYGVVIFTGHETKVMQNATDPPSKRSRIERRMDSIIYFLFSVLLLISIVGAIAFGIRTKLDMPSWWYMRPDNTSNDFNPNNAALSAFYQLITALILYGYLIPISLYISLEVVKLFQARLIDQDIHMYYEETDKPAHSRTSNLNEELGQVDTILSDKTGTLTCNQMDFLKASIAGVSYGMGVTEVEKATAKRMKKNDQEIREMPPELLSGIDDQEGIEMAEKPHVKGFNFYDKRIMDGKWVLESKPEMIQMFLRILSVCQTAIPEEDDDGRITYEAESPDEGAFVVAARELGFEFMKRTQNGVYIRECDLSGRSVEW
jgi:phospholipid-translocating ATPase